MGQQRLATPSKIVAAMEAERSEAKATVARYVRDLVRGRAKKRPKKAKKPGEEAPTEEQPQSAP